MKILLLLFGIIPFLAFDQSEVYYRNFDWEMNSNLSKHNYFLNGDRISVFTSSANANNSDRISVSKTSAVNGQKTQFDFIINEFVDSKVHGIVTYPDNSYTILLEHIGSNVSFILLRFASDNSLIWKERIYIPAFTSSYYNHEILDNETGGVFLMVSEYNFSGILNIDSNGQIVWANAFVGSQGLGKSPGFSLCKNASGSVNGTLKDQSYQCVFSLDNNGQEIWSKTFNDNQYRWPKKIIQTNDGGYIVGGTFYDSFNDESAYPYYTKFDAQGIIQFAKRIDLPNNEFWDIQQASDGSYYLLCGEYFSGVSFGILKTDVNGYIIDNKFMVNTSGNHNSRFTNTSHKLGFEIMLANEGYHGFVDFDGALSSLCGAHFLSNVYAIEDTELLQATINTGLTMYNLSPQILTDFTISYPSLDVIQTNELCNYVGNDELKDDEQIEVYPNPTVDQLTVDFNDYYVNNICLKDLNGKELYRTTSKTSGSINIDVSIFKSGVYFLELKMEEKTIIKKIVLN